FALRYFSCNSCAVNSVFTSTRLARPPLWYTCASMAELIGILRGEDQLALKHHTMRGSVKQMTKKKRQQRAQSRLALARFRKQQREQRQQTAAHRAQQGWNKTLRHLADLGATVKQLEEALGDKEKTVYEVTFEGKTSHFRSRFQVQRWLKRERERQE